MDKKYRLLMLAISFMFLVGCNNNSTKEVSSGTIVQLTIGNEKYISATYNSGDISIEKREDTAVNGQEPYAVVITCSDSRVVPEHIFNGGLGELFVIRTAGNVIAEFELGSIEYGAEHLQTDTIVVMGHTGCGAVDSAIKDNAHGNIKKITDEIQKGIGDEKDSAKAEIKNLEHGISKVMTSDVIMKLVEEGKVTVKGAIYNTNTGKVEFLESKTGL